MWWESFVDCLYTESVVQRNFVMENQAEEKEYQRFCFLAWEHSETWHTALQIHKFSFH